MGRVVIAEGCDGAPAPGKVVVVGIGEALSGGSKINCVAHEHTPIFSKALL